METKPTCMQVQISKETGEVLLLLETACGLRPVMVWPDVNEMKLFAMNLLRICYSQSTKGAGEKEV